MSENNEYENQIFYATGKVLNKISVIVSYVISLSLVAYIIGWLNAQAYFQNMGAIWLLNEMPLQTLLYLSWLPIFMILIITFYSFKHLLGSTNWVKKDKSYLAIITIMFMVVTVLQGVFEHFKYYQLWSVCSLLSNFGWAYLAVSALMTIIYSFKGLTTTFKTLLFDVAFIVVLFGMIILPSQMGNERYYRDVNYTISTLQQVNIIGDENKNYRLLFSNRDLFYAVELGTTNKKPPVKIFNQDQILNIQSVQK